MTPEEKLAEIDRRLTTIEVTLWGQHGENGIRSAIHDLRRKMDILLRFFWVATAVPPIVITLLAILKFIGKI